MEKQTNSVSSCTLRRIKKWRKSKWDITEAMQITPITCMFSSFKDQYQIHLKDRLLQRRRKYVCILSPKCRQHNNIYMHRSSAAEYRFSTSKVFGFNIILLTTSNGCKSVFWHALILSVHSFLLPSILKAWFYFNKRVQNTCMLKKNITNITQGIHSSDNLTTGGGAFFSYF